MRFFILILCYLGFAYFSEIWLFDVVNQKLPFSEYEKVNINAYFYFSDDKEIYLGQYKSASACQTAAKSYAYSKNISNENLGYICCTIEKGSSCYRKIK